MAHLTRGPARLPRWLLPTLGGTPHLSTRSRPGGTGAWLGGSGFANRPGPFIREIHRPTSGARHFTTWGLRGGSISSDLVPALWTTCDVYRLFTVDLAALPVGAGGGRSVVLGRLNVHVHLYGRFATPHCEQVIGPWLRTWDGLPLSRDGSSDI